jgi:hypothetical protein
MKRAVPGWVLLLMLTGPSALAAPPQGAALHRALTGVWCNSHDGGRSCWAYDEFLPDGRLRACGRQEDELQPFHGEGTVTVEGQRMCYLVTAASDNFWLRPGQRYCTDILAIDARSHRYRDIDTGEQFVLIRRDAASAVCPGAR